MSEPSQLWWQPTGHPVSHPATSGAQRWLKRIPTPSNFFLAVPDSRCRGFPPISLLPLHRASFPVMSRRLRSNSLALPRDYTSGKSPWSVLISSGKPPWTLFTFNKHFREIPFIGLHFFQETPLDFVRLQSSVTQVICSISAVFCIHV